MMLKSKSLPANFARAFAAVPLLVMLAVAGCAVGVKRSEGMNLYAAGRYAEAIPALEAEVAAGNVPARYSLGLAYRDGVGTAKDPAKAEILLTGAAIAGDPRAVAAIRVILESENRCPLDKKLHDAWGNVGTMNRNLITGVVELGTAPPGLLMQMADIYETPCPGRPGQYEASKSLRSYAGGPRTIWIYVP
jgi:TPR repeat protein